MKIIETDLNKDYLKAVMAVVNVLKQGGSAVFPTDTVYGLGANACDGHSVRQLYRIKNRPANKPIPVIVRNMKWAREVAFIPPKLDKVLEKIWPGPITIVLPKRPVISNEVSRGTSTVAVRIPDSGFVDAVLARFGYPLAVTSANISSRDGSNDAGLIIEAFKGRIWKPDIVIDAGRLSKSKPSTIVDFTKIKPRILRVGPVKAKELERIIGTEFK